MQDNASTYSRPSAASIFGEDGKLSSASKHLPSPRSSSKQANSGVYATDSVQGAATSLKYAKPQDLPSFPSSGGVQMSSAAGAASLANSNKKSFEHWKPDPIPAANKAAVLAKDYSMQPLWHPEATKAGSKAALTAHANPSQVEPLQPKRATTTKSPPTSSAYDTPANSRSKALMAANAVHNRRRSGSLPTQTAPKPKDETSWALKAAAKSHNDGPSSRAGPFAPGDPGFEASRVQNMSKDNATRQLYTSTPPVSIETQEKNRQDMLKASAVAMARKMYAIQQQHLDEAAGKQASRGRSATVGGSSNSASEDLQVAGGSYENLEEAARRLAQERLAKIHDEHAEYRNYYGAQTSPTRSRLSMRLRRRASSGTGGNRADDSDEENSRRIRSQMSIFQSKLAEVDSKKRQSDRDALLVIAHRNVDAQISKMDEKVFQETGKASPAQMEKWERAAREKAQRDSDERMQNTGKVHIGGGQYIDQSELDAIAKARLQPTLDDITFRAEQQRAKDEEYRLDREKKEREAQTEKTRAASIAAELRAANEKARSEEKARKAAEKREQKEYLDADKQRRKTLAAADKERDRLEKEQTKERERQEREEAQKSKGDRPGRFSTFLSRGSSNTPATAGTTTATTTTSAADDPETSQSESSSERSPSGAKEAHDDKDAVESGPSFHDQVTEQEGTATKVTAPEPATPSKTEDESEPTGLEKVTSNERSSTEMKSPVNEDKEGPTSPGKTKSRVKSWMKVRFRSKSTSQKDNEIMPAVAESEEAKATKDESATEDADKDTSRPESIRDVAMAGRTSHESDDLYGPPRGVSPSKSKDSKEDATRERSPSISSLSSHYSEETKDGKSARSTKSEEATIEEAKVVEIKPQTSNDVHESDTDQKGRSGFKARLLRKITPNKTGTKEDNAMTPSSPSAAYDESEEARDTFEEGKLSPPAPLSTVTGENAQSTDAAKTVSPKTSREQSRFTEDL